MPKRSIPEISLETQLIYERLIKAKPGEIISYEELAGIIKKNPQAEGYGNVASARRKALNEDRMVFEAVAGVGIKCLTDEEKAMTGEHTIKLIRRRANRGAKKLLAVKNYDALSDEAKKRHNATLSQLGTIKLFSSQSATTKIENKVKETGNKKLAAGRVLELFK